MPDNGEPLAFIFAAVYTKRLYITPGHDPLSSPLSIFRSSSSRGALDELRVCEGCTMDVVPSSGFAKHNLNRCASGFWHVEKHPATKLRGHLKVMTIGARAGSGGKHIKEAVKRLRIR